MKTLYSPLRILQSLSLLLLLLFNSSNRRVFHFSRSQFRPCNIGHGIKGTFWHLRAAFQGFDWFFLTIKVSSCFKFFYHVLLLDLVAHLRLLLPRTVSLHLCMIRNLYLTWLLSQLGVRGHIPYPILHPVIA